MTYADVLIDQAVQIAELRQQINELRAALAEKEAAATATPTPAGSDHGVMKAIPPTEHAE